VYEYEAKKITGEMIVQLGILSVSLIIILIFGGVIFDIYAENEWGSLIGDFRVTGIYSISKIREMGLVVLNEIPNWIFLTYIFGIIVGCILVVSVIQNWSRVSHRVRSLFHYWFR